MKYLWVYFTALVCFSGGAMIGMTLVVPPMPNNATNNHWLWVLAVVTVVGAIGAAVSVIRADLAE